MKVNSLILVAVTMIGIFFAFLAPANIKDKLVGVATFATNERKCFNFHKQDFNDPDSAYVESSHIWTKKDEIEALGGELTLADDAFLKYDAMLNVKVKSKNLMGAYVTEWVECPLIKGSFSESEARSNKLNGNLKAAPAVEISPSSELPEPLKAAPVAP